MLLNLYSSGPLDIASTWELRMCVYSCMFVFVFVRECVSVQLCHH